MAGLCNPAAQPFIILRQLCAIANAAIQGETIIETATGQARLYHATPLAAMGTL
jgi:hypothetical protein